MTYNCYDKVKLIILRAALVLLGAGTGFLALWQYFLFYPNVVGREYQIVITVVSSALIALMFGLSAKAVYRLVSSVASAVRGLKDSMGARGIIAVLLGFFVAGGIAVAFDFAIKLAVDIWAVRLLADILAFIPVAAGCCIGFTKLLTSPRSRKTENDGAPAVGYLLAAECFSDERVLTAVHTLINVKVCDGAYKALCLYGGEAQRGAESARLMDALIKGGAISVLKTGKTFDDCNAYERLEKQLAASKRLKRIAIDADTKELSIAAFSPPTAEISAAVAELLGGAAENEKNEPQPLRDTSCMGEVNGQIIIDK